MESAAYQRHAPEETLLYRIVQEHWKTFEAFARERDPAGRGLPRYVRNAFEGFLECGILQHGFVRVRCPACELDSVVAFSCKQRGVCPSCAARRMSDTAAQLVDRIFPRVPVRQWVLSLPRPMRYVLARDSRLLSRPSPLLPFRRILPFDCPTRSRSRRTSCAPSFRNAASRRSRNSVRSALSPGAGVDSAGRKSASGSSGFRDRMRWKAVRIAMIETQPSRSLCATASGGRG